MPQRLLPFVLACTLALPLSIQAQTPPALDTVMARVNGTEITLAHVLDARRSLPQEYQNVPDNVLFEGILDQLVQQELLAQAAGESIPPWIYAAGENMVRMLTAGVALETSLRSDITEADIQAAYEARIADESQQIEYNASHILVDTRDAAQSLIADLEQGANFATLAREHSTGPSGPNGGELGWFGAGMMVPAFEAAVTALEVGTVSPPVETQFGWHVVKLNDKRSPEVPELEQIRGELTLALEQAAVEAQLERLQQAAEITIPGASMDPSVLSTVPLSLTTQ